MGVDVDARMRVLMATNSLANGGLERQLSLLARSLPEQFEVRIWSMEGGPHAQAVVAAGVGLEFAPRRYRLDVRPAWDLWRAIFRWRPRVVHAWHWMPAAAAVPACLALRVPLIDGSIRMGSVPREFGRPRSTTIRCASAVVANTRAGLAAWRVPAPKGRVIYNAFEDERIASAALRVREPGSRPFTVVMAARMEPPKDYITVIDAARRLAADDPGGWRFVLVGDGADRARITSYASDLVSQRVAAFPVVGTEAIGHVLQADAGVLISDPAILAEGCSNSIMEYMACQLPVVSTDSGGCRELITHGKHGFLVPPRNPAALAARLEWLRDHPDESTAMGKAGAARIRRDFSAERLIAEYVKLYKELEA